MSNRHNVDRIMPKLLQLLGSDYKNVEVLSLAGGMNPVFSAHHPSLGRHVAIKVHDHGENPSERDYGRFRRGAEALGSLESHPNICPVFDWKSDPELGISCLIMMLVRGRSLSERLKEGPLSIDETVTLAEQMLSALKHTHGHGIIHRDIKPGNILLPVSGPAQLTDFGLAKGEEGMDITRSGAGAGTPAYMSPEQAWFKKPDRRTDIYSLGLVLAECLTAQRLFVETDFVELLRKKREEPTPNLDLPSSCPSGLVSMLEIMSRAEPDDRPADASGVLTMLTKRDASLGASRQAGVVVDISELPTVKIKRYRSWWVGGAILAIWAFLAFALDPLVGAISQKGNRNGTPEESIFARVSDQEGEGHKPEKVVQESPLDGQSDPEPRAAFRNKSDPPPPQMGYMTLKISLDGGIAVHPQILIDGKPTGETAPANLRWKVKRGDSLRVEVRHRDYQFVQGSHVIVGGVDSTASIVFR